MGAGPTPRPNLQVPGENSGRLGSALSLLTEMRGRVPDDTQTALVPDYIRAL